MRSTGKVEKKRGGGRPPKFAEPRRPITVTLPERILNKLKCVNTDLCRAIVKCVEAVTGENAEAMRQVELIEVAPGHALIVVGPCPSLMQIKWLRLVEIAPARYLLVLPSGTQVEVLEVALHDLLVSPDLDAKEKDLLTELRDVIGHQRRGKMLSKAELLFVDVRHKK